MKLNNPRRFDKPAVRSENLLKVLDTDCANAMMQKALLAVHGRIEAGLLVGVYDQTTQALAQEVSAQITNTTWLRINADVALLFRQTVRGNTIEEGAAELGKRTNQTVAPSTAAQLWLLFRVLVSQPAVNQKLMELYPSLKRVLDLNVEVGLLSYRKIACASYTDFDAMLSRLESGLDI